MSVGLGSSAKFRNCSTDLLELHNVRVAFLQLVIVVAKRGLVQHLGSLGILIEIDLLQPGLFRGDQAGLLLDLLAIVFVRSSPLVFLFLGVVFVVGVRHLLFDRILGAGKIRLDQALHVVIARLLQRRLVAIHLGETCLIVCEDGDGFFDGLRVVDADLVIGAFGFELRKFAQSTGEVIRGSDFVHLVPDGVGVDVILFRAGILWVEPLAVHLDAACDDFFLLLLEFVDHFLNLRGLRCAWVTVHEGAKAVLDDLLILFRGEQVGRGHELAQFFDLDLLGLLLEHAGDVCGGDEFFVVDLGGDLVFDLHASVGLLKDGTLELGAVLEGDEVGVKQAGGSGGDGQ